MLKNHPKFNANATINLASKITQACSGPKRNSNAI